MQLNARLADQEVTRTMRLAICDDDVAFLSHSSSMVRLWATMRNIDDATVEQFADGDALIRAHSATPFDVILLDVVMPLVDGIEVAREIRATDKGVKLVFLTSSPEYAVDSYTVKASNYLLKPIDPAALTQCLDELAQETRAAERKIVIKGARSVHSVNPPVIEYVEAQGKHVKVALANGRTIDSIEPFYSFDEKLSLEDGFFKCHRSYIININHISSYTSDEATMRSGVRIPISRSCRSEFKELYFSVIFGKDSESTW